MQSLFAISTTVMLTAILLQFPRVRPARIARPAQRRRDLDFEQLLDGDSARPNAADMDFVTLFFS